MTTLKFKAGDVVQLKSGGPAMTVNGIDNAGIVQCTWFAGKKHELGRFRPETLVAVEDKDDDADDDDEDKDE